MDFWHFYIPIAAVGMLSVIYELCRKERAASSAVILLAYCLELTGFGFLIASSI